MNYVIFRGYFMGQSYYFFQSGRLSRKDNTIEFRNHSQDKRSIPVERVREIYMFGEIDFNSKFMNFIAQNKICVHWFNYYGFYSGSFYPRESLVSGRLLIKQVQHYQDPNKRLELAKKFVEGASYNIYRNIRYYNQRGKKLNTFLSTINGLRKKIEQCQEIRELMGIEGNIRKQYYRAWNTIIDQNIEFRKRVKRPPNNIINTLLSYVNSLVYTRVLSQIYRTQLNPTISYLHEPGERRFSLCLDIAEIFKPILGDRLIFSLLNRRQITPESFEKGLNFLYMKENTVKLITKEFDMRTRQTIKHKKLGREVSYNHLIRLEAYKLIKHLTGEQQYEPFKMWW